MDASLNIGRTIARERRRMGVTQEELANHLGVSKAAVSKWELAQSLPDVSLLPRIAAYFSLTLDELFDWRDELTEGEAVALYAEVYALGERDLSAAYARLRALAAEHYSDANLLLMMASLLTTWAAGVEAPQGSAAERDGSTGHAADAAADGAQGATDGEDAAGDAGEPGALPDAIALAGEALGLLDRVLEVAADPVTLFLAQQQKATTLFQMGRFGDAAALLEPLARRQDAGAVVMLLASAYRKLDRADEALDLLQLERLRAASFVLSSLMQEVAVRDDAAFVRAADKAARALLDALGMAAINPLYPATMGLEVADAFRRAGEKDEALEALGRAVDAAASVAHVSSGPADAPLWDRINSLLDPAHVGGAWAEHKVRQAAEAATTLKQAVAEQGASGAWREFAGDDPRYREIAAAAQRLAND